MFTNNLDISNKLRIVLSEEYINKDKLSDNKVY